MESPGYMQGRQKAFTATKNASRKSSRRGPQIEMFGGQNLIINVPSNFFQCARKSIVFERHIFMPQRLNFFTDVTQDKNEIKSHVTLA